MRIVYSPAARADLLSIQNYIADKDGEDRAVMVLGRIEETVRLLAFLPGMGRARSGFGRNARFFPVSPWLIVHRPLPGLDGIRILRVVDGWRDLPAMLQRRRS